LPKETHRRLLRNQLKGCWPKTKLSNAILKNLYVYAGNEHPHEAQKPKVIKIKLNQIKYMANHQRDREKKNSRCPAFMLNRGKAYHYK